MNRRSFLKSIATVCGAAVVCPGELVKLPIKHLWMRGKGGSYIEGEWHNFKVFPSEAERKKYRQNIIVKARQQGIQHYTMHNFDGRRSGFIITRPT